MVPFMQCFIHLHANAVVGGCVVLGSMADSKAAVFDFEVRSEF